MVLQSLLHRRSALHAIRWSITSQIRKQSNQHGSGPLANNDSAPPRLHYGGIRRLISLGSRSVGVILGVHIFAEYFFAVGESYGISMLPTLNSTGDWLIMSKYYRRGRDIEVGDLVSFKHPIEESTRSVKRVVGMPGDYVLRDTPGTSDLMIQIPQGHCYVVGDNLQFSRDSRHFGPLPLALIRSRVVGRLTFQRLWPEFFTRGLQPAGSDDET